MQDLKELFQNSCIYIIFKDFLIQKCFDKEMLLWLGREKLWWKAIVSFRLVKLQNGRTYAQWFLFIAK